MNHESSPLQKQHDEFEAWRSNRQGRKAIPLALRQQAVNLRSTYPVSKIIATLSINHCTLKRWAADTTAEPTPNFIQLPALAPELDSVCVTTEVLCELPNAVRLTINSLTLTHTFLSTLTQLNTGIQP